MTAKIDGGNLIITIPLHAPTASKSGKTLVVASSGGNKPTAATLDGKPIIIGVNACVNK